MDVYFKNDWRNLSADSVNSSSANTACIMREGSMYHEGGFHVS